MKLEDEFLLQNKSPWVFLVCNSLKPDLVQQTQNLFKLEIKKVKNEYFFFSKDLKLNHKEKSLILFFASLFISCNDHQVAMCLGQYNNLAKRIQRSDLSHQNILFSETEAESYKLWKREKGSIFLQNEFKIYLEQAGLDVKNDLIQGAEWTSQFLNENKQFTILSKVG